MKCFTFVVLRALSVAVIAIGNGIENPSSNPVSVSLRTNTTNTLGNIIILITLKIHYIYI